MSEHTALLSAAAFAARAHAHQRRKGVAAAPYINHCLEVARLISVQARVTDTDILCAAILHDVVEDTPVTIAQLQQTFGGEIAGYVAEVTDDRSLPRAVRKQQQIEHAPHLTVGASLIKLSDKISNVRDLVTDPPPAWDAARLLGYVRWAGRVVSALRHRDERLEAEFLQVCAQARRSHQR